LAARILPFPLTKADVVKAKMKKKGAPRNSQSWSSTIGHARKFNWLSLFNHGEAVASVCRQQVSRLLKFG